MMVLKMETVTRMNLIKNKKSFNKTIVAYVGVKLITAVTKFLTWRGVVTAESSLRIDF